MLKYESALRRTLFFATMLALVAALLCGVCLAGEPGMPESSPLAIVASTGPVVETPLQAVGSTSLPDLPDDVFTPPDRKEPRRIEPTALDAWLQFMRMNVDFGKLRGWWPDVAPKILIAAISPCPIPLEGDGVPDQGDAYEKALPSVVLLNVVDDCWNTSLGTGVIVDAERGYILTAYHVASPGKVVMAYPQMKDGDGNLILDRDKLLTEAARLNSYVRCIPIARSAEKDLTLLRVDNLKLRFKQMPIATRSARPGQTLFTIGNSTDGPLWRFSSGNVRQVFEKALDYPEGQKVNARFVETTVPTNPGDSGGPLIDQSGNLVGINSSYTVNANQINHGVDVVEIRRFLDQVTQLLANREREKAARPKS